MLTFKIWLEEHDLFGHKKKELREEIIKTLEPNKGNAVDVTSSRISEFGSDDDVTSRHGRHILNLFNKNPRIWELMAQAFPGEEETLKNRVTQWLEQSQPQHQIADLFNVIGIGDDPIVKHAAPKPKQQQPQQPPAATQQPSPGLPDPAVMPGQTTF
tara:strand:+ start:31403 stop:31873 length:471 start_codon:yes stop_codon:yes gene_type:complete